MNLVRDNLERYAVVAVVIRPVSRLDTTAYSDELSLAEITRDEFGCLIPRDDIDKISRRLVRVGALAASVNRQSERRNGRIVLRVSELRVTRQPPH